MVAAESPQGLKRTASQMLESKALSQGGGDQSPPTFDQFLNANNRVRISSDTKCSTYYIGGAQIHFPFAPYPSQLGMMNHMVRALNGSHNTMIESPTGSGKSLALLCAALGWRRHFAAKRTQSKTCVINVIRKFAKHNSLPDFHGGSSPMPVKGEHPAKPTAAKKEPESVKPEETDQSEPAIKPKLEAEEEPADADISEPDIKLETEPKHTIDHKDACDKDSSSSKYMCHSKTDETDISHLKVTHIKGNPMEQATKTESEASIKKRLLGAALCDLPQTATYILNLAKTRVPPGLEAEDISKLEDYKKNFAH
ncbi:Fanconi anemia group J protein, partial [Coemansia sp. RSA 2559]